MIRGIIFDCFGVLYEDAARNDALLAYIEELRGGYKIGMLSNVGPGSMARYFSDNERKAMFDVVVMSGEEGIAKPHPDIFIRTAQRLGLQPGECLMIDDSADNCAGAEAVGMRSLLFRSTPQAIQDLGKLLERENA